MQVPISSSSVLFHWSHLSRQSTIVFEHYSIFVALLTSYVTGLTKLLRLKHHASSSYQYHISKVMPGPQPATAAPQHVPEK